MPAVVAVVSTWFSEVQWRDDQGPLIGYPHRPHEARQIGTASTLVSFASERKRACAASLVMCRMIMCCSYAFCLSPGNHRSSRFREGGLLGGRSGLYIKCNNAPNHGPKVIQELLPRWV